ncbi:MAG: EAL domain-containing protein, partial [Hyphomicrobiaceae bacterium]
PTNREFIKSLVENAHAFGLDTVAAWVADEETARICAECGITHMQGFLFGHPQIEREFRQKPASGVEAC